MSHHARTHEDLFPIRGFDHVEFYVGNARQSAHFYDKTFGFKPVAKMGQETGCRTRASYVMQQGVIRFVLTCALTPDDEVARHCALHGDGVKVIGVEVGDCDLAMRELKTRGATILQPSTAVKDEFGTLKTGIIKYAGDTVFKFVERGNYDGPFAPGYKPLAVSGAGGVGLAAIDHIVTNVHLGEMTTGPAGMSR